MTDIYSIQNEIYAEGFDLLCGVDEAGRGPLAGPVCAAAVILPRGFVIPGLGDSKAITEKRRETLYDDIIAAAISYGIALASVSEIEEMNILNATFLAMNRAIGALEPAPELALIDGNQSRGIEFPCRTFVKGDANCALIAAASILAKVTRDRHMRALAEEYPEYGFEKHKGYGTAAHCEAILTHGATPAHRASFLKKLYAGRTDRG